MLRGREAGVVREVFGRHFKIKLQYEDAAKLFLRKLKGVTDPDVFMVRAVSLRLPPEDSWVDVGAPYMQAKLGADFGYEL